MHLSEIEATAKQSAEPIVLTRSGKPALVVIDSQAYNERIQRERHIAKLKSRKSTVRFFLAETSRKRIRGIARYAKAAHA